MPLEDLQDLVGAAAALPQRHPGDLVFMRVPADPEAELEASARQILQAGDVLRGENRIAQCRNQNAGRKLDIGCAAGGEAERFERRQPRRAVETARGQQMLDDPERLEALRLGPLREIAPPRRLRIIEIGKREARQDQPEPHVTSSILLPSWPGLARPSMRKKLVDPRVKPGDDAGDW